MHMLFVNMEEFVGTAVKAPFVDGLLCKQIIQCTTLKIYSLACGY